MKQPQLSLRDRICAARSITEIEALLHEGRRYALAMRRTQEKWKTAATQRAHELALAQSSGSNLKPNS